MQESIGSIKINLDNKLKAYIEYLKLEVSTSEYYGLDAIQVRILNEIFMELSSGKSLRVGDILTHREIASPATLHAGLKKLVKNQMIFFRTIPESRVKYIEFTSLGKKRISDLSKFFSSK